MHKKRCPWLDALNYVAKMIGDAGFCGATDWRLAIIVESGLLPRTKKADFAAWLNIVGFTNVLGCNVQ